MGYFKPEDDLMHDLGPAPSRESWVWAAPVPDEQLMTFVYVHRSADERWGHLVFVGGPDPFEPLFFDHRSDLELEGSDLDDGAVGGLRIRHTDPLKVVELDYQGEGLSLSCRFEGLHEPFSWHENPGGCPAWIATDRYEQSCRAQGTVQLGDRRVELAGGGHRDHSWGPRNWNMLQHWKWINAIADEVSLNAMVIDARGDRIVLGYLNQGGDVSPLISVEASADLDDRMIHRGVSARMVDQAGRSAHLEARYAAACQMPFDPLVLNEVGMSATLDDRPAVAHIEFGWPSYYVNRLTDAA